MGYCEAECLEAGQFLRYDHRELGVVVLANKNICSHDSLLLILRLQDYIFLRVDNAPGVLHVKSLFLRQRAGIELADVLALGIILKRQLCNGGAQKWPFPFDRPTSPLLLELFDLIVLEKAVAVPRKG